MGLGTAPLGISGCASGSPPPIMSDVPYTGPAVEVEALAGMWVVVVRSPTPGWKVRVDRLWEEYGAQGVYVSLKEPNPAFSYPSTVVEQRLATGVRAADPAKIYVQQFKFTGEASGVGGYSFAAAAGLEAQPK